MQHARTKTVRNGEGLLQVMELLQKTICYFEQPHLLLVEIVWGWALQGDSGARHSGAGTSEIGHSRETLGLGTSGLREECTGRGEEFRARRRVEFNNLTPRVGKNP